MSTSSSSSPSPSGPHVLVFPYPAQGHMITLLDFSYHLALRGLKVTILTTPQNLPLLQPLLHLSSNSKSPTTTTQIQIHPLIFPFPNHPSIPPGVENVKDLPPNGFLLMMEAMSHLHQPIVRWFRSLPSNPPVAIISDLFLGWTHRLAADLGIRRVLFSPSGAKAIAYVNSLWRHMPRPASALEDADADGFHVGFPEIPNSPKYPWRQVSPVYRSYRDGDQVSEFLKEGMRANLASWGIVFNSFSELEDEYMDYTRRDVGHSRVWAVGPLLPSKEVGSMERGGSGLAPAGKLMTWLDGQADASVAYVCFGSQAELTRSQVEALADGLDQSGVHFVWVMKQSSGDSMVPTGFEDRVDGRGLVIKGWAPQVAILGHRAVGSFLTHCGWNSVLEAVMAGVPMLTWPMGADQYLNATLLVDELGVGVRVCEGDEEVPDSDELARVLAESLRSDRAERVRAKELSRMAVGAVEEGGSSFRDIDAFVKELCSPKPN